MFKTELKNTNEDWTLSKLPPKDHDDVGPFFYNLFLFGEYDKERLGLPDRWRFNHRMFRGDHWDTPKGASKRVFTRMVMNLTFANIQRTVANLTAREPVVEAFEVGNMDGSEGEDYNKVLSAWLKKWWSDTEQATTLVDSANEMEIYGPTIEKSILRGGRPNTAVVDPFAFGKAPGIYDSIQDMPYVYHLGVMRTDEIEEIYDLPEGTVESDEVYDILGEDREEDNAKTVESGAMPNGTVNAMTGAPLNLDKRTGRNRVQYRALMIEIWCKTNDKEKYPDGIRVVTLTNGGKLVLDDATNPNINWSRYNKDDDNKDAISKTYMFGRLPFNMVVSYRDKTTNWGFSALEQTSDINQVIDEVLSRLYAYIIKSMMPILIIPKDTGIQPAQINNRPGLILRPASSAQAGSIRYVDPPRVSTDIYKFIQLLRDFFDLVWHIEDADRGERPTGVIAASAIQALQERNAVLMRAKIRAIDSLVRVRGRAAISMLQNFGTDPEFVSVDDEMKEISGKNIIGREFQFAVESGSTVHKTTLQVQEQAVQLYDRSAIDRKALLEALDFPNHKSILERVGETQLDQALQVLIDAGMTEEEARAVKQILMQPQEEGNMEDAR